MEEETMNQEMPERQGMMGADVAHLQLWN